MFAAIDHLESRILLNATAVLNGDTLTITGDNAKDRFACSGDDGPGTVKIDFEFDGSDEFTFSGVANIIVNTFGGADAVLFDNLNITGNLFVDTGKGRDQFGIQTHSEVHGNLTVKTGSGRDVVALGPNEGPLLVGGNVDVDTGKGRDYFLVGGLFVSGTALFNGNGGHDILDTGSGANGFNTPPTVISIEVGSF